MDRGLYTATSGGMNNVTQIDVISNNLANVNTVGFKAQRLVTKQQEFSDTLASKLEGLPGRAQADFNDTPGVVSVATSTDFTQGPISETGNPLHVAIGQDNAFFTIQTPEGNQYTRAGNFTLDAERTIVTPDGYPVVGSGGPIQLPTGQATITANGSVVVDGDTVAQLQLVQFQDLKPLQRVEGTRFTAQGLEATPVESPRLVTRSVELPNVNVVEAMVQLVNASRAFEGYQKTVRTIDELNEQVIRSARSF